MTRHFLGLYLLIVLTLAASSWGQDKLLQHYGRAEAGEDGATSLALTAVEERLRTLPPAEWPRLVAALAAASGVEMEMLKLTDIAGAPVVAKLRQGKIAHLRAARGESWALKGIGGEDVLSVKDIDPDARRGPLDWVLTLVFYATIALAIMLWIWPLARDLRALEKATALYGNRNWRFDARIGPRSQVFPLAETFRAMAARIDGLIASHKDMFNAVAHEIKTPLSRMQFEIELAQKSTDSGGVAARLGNIKADIAAIDALVTAALDYAILERAEISPNLAAHDLAALVPAIVDHVHADTRADLRMTAQVRGDAAAVVCDAHLFETLLRNLLYNAARYARGEVRVSLDVGADAHCLTVEDDGPGIPEKDRNRVFDSFVQLDGRTGQKRGFGLGLAIVKRIALWHHGEVGVGSSPLGGAMFRVSWPNPPPGAHPPPQGGGAGGPFFRSA